MPALRMMNPKTLPLNLSASAQASQSAVKSSSSTPASASRSGNLGSSGQHIPAAGKSTVTWSVGMVVVIEGDGSGDASAREAPPADEATKWAVRRHANAHGGGGRWGSDRNVDRRDALARCAGRCARHEQRLTRYTCVSPGDEKPPRAQKECRRRQGVYGRRGLSWAATLIGHLALKLPLDVH